MDGHRFDRFARSLAAWTSRRRFLTGAAGGAAGGLLAAHRVRAQEATPPPDPGVLEAIVEMSTAALPRLEALLLVDNNLRLQEFDPVRLPLFIERLQALVQQGMQANQWDAAQLQSFLDTILLIPLAVSVGRDGDAYLDQYALQQLGPKATPQVYPEIQDECITAHRPITCTATCLDVWLVQQTEAADAGDMAAMVAAFFNFLECFLYWGNDATQCLGPLIDQGCIPRIHCGCSGDCFP